MRKSLILGLVAPFVSVAAHAATITPTVSTSAGTTYNTAALTGFATDSADMVGSLVTVRFADGSTSSASWTASGASATGWSLTFSGDTVTDPWTLGNRSTLAILGMTFNGVPGNTAFDVISDPTDSPGSARGKEITSVDGPTGMTVSALYTNRLTVDGTFYGDLYTTMNLTFGGGGLTTGNTLRYVTDTDNALASAGGITPSVPEPATWAMMMLGFGGIGMALRRRPKVSARIRFV